MQVSDVRRLLREALDSPGFGSNESPQEEETPTAVTELPIHELPVNVTAGLDSESTEPPVRDVDYIPGNAQELQHAAGILVGQVPPLQVQQFYHGLKRLVSKSMKDQKPDPTSDMAMIPDQEPWGDPDAIAEQTKIYDIVREQLAEKKVRGAIQVLLEQAAGLDVLSDPDFVEGLTDEMFSQVRRENRKADIIDALQAALAAADDGSTAAASAEHYLAVLGVKQEQPADEPTGARRVSGQTGSEEVDLQTIADVLGMGSSGVRNIQGRVPENIGTSWVSAADKRDAIDMATHAANDIFEMAAALILLKYGDRADVLSATNPHREAKESVAAISDAIRQGSALFHQLPLETMEDVPNKLEDMTMVDIKNHFLRKFFKGEFNAVGFTQAIEKIRGFEEVPGRSGKMVKKQIRGAGESMQALRNMEQQAGAFSKSVNDVINVYADKTADDSVVDAQLLAIDNLLSYLPG